MNAGILRPSGWWLALALLGGSQCALADDQGEADFKALREKVQSLRPFASPEVRERIAKAETTVTACLPGTPEPEDSRLGLALDDVDYFYGAPYTSTDGAYQCIYLVEPLHRALTADEAHDFLAATMLPDVPHALLGKTGRARKAAVAARGEQKFADLRAFLATGVAPAIDPAHWAAYSGPTPPTMPISWIAPPFPTMN